MFTLFFSHDPVADWDSDKKCYTVRFGEFFHFMLERGVYLAPSQFEAAFLSTAHTEEDIRYTVAAVREFFSSLVEDPIPPAFQRCNREGSRFSRFGWRRSPDILSCRRSRTNRPRLASAYASASRWMRWVPARSSNLTRVNAGMKSPAAKFVIKLPKRSTLRIVPRQEAGPRRAGRAVRSADVVVDQLPERGGLRTLRQVSGSGSEDVASVKSAADFAAHELRIRDHAHLVRSGVEHHRKHSVIRRDEEVPSSFRRESDAARCRRRGQRQQHESCAWGSTARLLAMMKAAPGRSFCKA